MVANHPIGIVLAMVAFCSCSGGGSTPDAGYATPDAEDPLATLRGFIKPFAEALCARAASCCTPDDFQAVMGFSQTTCEASLSNVENAVQLVQFGIRRYDPAMAAACLQRIASAPCTDVFPSIRSDSDPCGKFTVGARPLGSVCDGDYYCASTDCEAQRCITPPCTATSCPDGKYCMTNVGCAALVTQGTACTGDDMCGSQGACVNGVCVPLLEDGVACRSHHQCGSGTCGLVSGSTAKTCRQPYCQGS
jgi:hypothetical protein